MENPPAVECAARADIRLDDLMNANQASTTAEYMALFRALESARPAGKRLFDDPFAQAFLRPWLRRVVTATRWPLVNATIARLIDARWPGARTSAIARTCFIDGEVRAALARGIEQVVILGAG
jgi:O-methyltransferase involved in polyketide biosynthesis